MKFSKWESENGQLDFPKGVLQTPLPSGNYQQFDRDIQVANKEIRMGLGDFFNGDTTKVYEEKDKNNGEWSILKVNSASKTNFNTREKIIGTYDFSKDNFTTFSALLNTHPTMHLMSKFNIMETESGWIDQIQRYKVDDWLREIDTTIDLSLLLNGGTYEKTLETNYSREWKYSDPTYIEEASVGATIPANEGTPFSSGGGQYTGNVVNAVRERFPLLWEKTTSKYVSVFRYDQDSSRNNITRTGAFLKVSLVGTEIVFSVYWKWTGKLGSDHYMVDANIEDLKRYKKNVEGRIKASFTTKSPTSVGDSRTSIPGSQTTMFDNALTRFKDMRITLIPK